jgi:transposase InsO family protein
VAPLTAGGLRDPRRSTPLLLGSVRPAGCLLAQPKYLIHDRDAVYGNTFDARLAKLGIASVRTPVRAPRANAIGERVVRSIRTECLDHAIVINERHLHPLLAEYVTNYNVDRPHRSLGLQSPLPRSPTRDGRVVWRPVLEGLHQVYARAA